jgi:hypothetical protein
MRISGLHAHSGQQRWTLPVGGAEQGHSRVFLPLLPRQSADARDYSDPSVVWPCLVVHEVLDPWPSSPADVNRYPARAPANCYHRRNCDVALRGPEARGAINAEPAR